MFEKYLSRNLKDGEEVIRFVRRYAGSMALPFGGVAILVLAPFFLLFPLLRWGLPGVAVLFALVFIGLLVLVRTILLFTLNVLIITNQRLIDVDQRGFFHRVVSESTYDKIQDVSFSMKGLLQTLFRYGDVHIQTAGAQANLEVRNVRDPEKVQELIVKLQAELQRQNSGSTDRLSAQELLALVQRLKRGLGDSEFTRLVGGGRRKP